MLPLCRGNKFSEFVKALKTFHEEKRDSAPDVYFWIDIVSVR